MPKKQSNEADILLAIQNIELSKNLSLRKAAQYYDVSRTTLTSRINVLRR